MAVLRMVRGCFACILIWAVCAGVSAQTPFLRDFIGVAHAPIYPAYNPARLEVPLLKTTENYELSPFYTNFSATNAPQQAFAIDPLALYQQPPLATPTNPSAISATQWQSDPHTLYQASVATSLFAARYGYAPALGFPKGFDSWAVQKLKLDSPDQLGLRTVRYLILKNTASRLLEPVSPLISGEDPRLLRPYNPGIKQYADLLSAVYDGQQNSQLFEIKNDRGNLIAHSGVHNVASNTKMFLEMPANWDAQELYFLKKRWDDSRSGRNYPFDGIIYQVNADAFATQMGLICPECPATNLRSYLMRLLQDQVLPPESGAFEVLFPNKPAWVTGLAYASESAVGSANKSQQQTSQGQWITRSILEASAVRFQKFNLEKYILPALIDDPAAPDTALRHAGLLRADGFPKKSWFHFKTLKSVLDYAQFSHTNAIGDIRFVADNAICPIDNPRIYTYLREAMQPQKATLALWLPQGDRATKDGFLLIPNQMGEPPPRIQAIEVVEYDEDGKRTLVAPSCITQYTDGKAYYWKVSGIRPGDTKITLTETPLYLRINQKNMASDIVPPPVQNLTASPLGCTDIRLSWENPVKNSAFYDIYYQSIPCTGTPGAFDPSNCTLAIDHLPGNAQSAVISGLTRDSCYVFWVIPFVANANSQDAPTFSPPDLSAPVAGLHYVIHRATAEDGRFTQLTNRQIEITVTHPEHLPFSSPQIQDALKAFIPPAAAEICAEMEAPNSQPSQSGIHVPSGTVIQSTVTFPDAQYLDAMYLHYLGTSHVTIEYQKDCCDGYTLYKTFDLGEPNAGHWLRIANSAFNCEKIDKIRLTVEALYKTGAQIGRILFYSRPALDKCAETLGLRDNEVLTQVGPAHVNYLSSDAAVIAWEPARRYIDTVDLAPVNRYTVQYSIAVDAAGKLVLPLEKTCEMPVWGGENTLLLSQLMPNTAYFVDILPNKETYPCQEFYPAPRRLSLTTLPETSNTEKTDADLDLRLSPNPVTDVLRLQNPANGYAFYTLMQSNGVHIEEGTLLPSGQVTEIPLRGLSSGIYLLTCQGNSRKICSKAFIIQKPE